jgi:hypothetical protein
MRANTFSGITLESSTRDDPLLVDIAHLVLELSPNENVVDKIGLLCRKTAPGLWNTEQTLAM